MVTNERTLDEAVALIRVLVAYSHAPLPRDLLEQASKFLEAFPYEPPPPHCDCDKCTAARLQHYSAEKSSVVRPLVECGACHECLKDKRDPVSGLSVSALRMIVCLECGNKRCPKATDHRHACTHSNASGQPGSIYS